jgi:hypothetical protein
MVSFNAIVLSVAVIILIIILAYMGSVMSTAKTNIVFPPTANICPDGWTPTSDGTCTSRSNGPNVGAIVVKNIADRTTSTPNVSVSVSEGGNVYTLDPASVIWASSGKSSICGKQAWAGAIGVVWDGISNYNSC